MFFSVESSRYTSQWPPWSNELIKPEDSPRRTSCSTPLPHTPIQRPSMIQCAWVVTSCELATRIPSKHRHSLLHLFFFAASAFSNGSSSADMTSGSSPLSPMASSRAFPPFTPSIADTAFSLATSAFSRASSAFVVCSALHEKAQSALLSRDIGRALGCRTTVCSNTSCARRHGDALLSLPWLISSNVL